jgi:hypothetical protein
MTGSSNPQTTNLKLQRLGIGIVLLMVPLMLLALPLPPSAGTLAVYKQNWVLAGGIVLAVLSLVAYLIPTPLLKQSRPVLPLILLGTSLLLIGQIGWNKAYRKYVATHAYRREVFRRPMHNLWAPIYGREDNSLARWNPRTGRYGFQTLPWAIASAAVAAAWFAWARRRPIDRPWEWRSLAILMAFQLALIVAFAACEPWPMRFSLKISGYSEFKQDLPAFTGVADVFRTYVQKMPDLQWYGKHYPPGNLSLLMIEKKLGIPGLTKSIVCLCTVLAAVPLMRLARELELDNVATSAAVLLFTATTGVLIYCTINTTSLLLLPATTCLWMLVRGLRTGSITAAVGLGAAYVCYVMFSFSASIFGILMALTAAIGWWTGAFSTRNVIRTGAIALACVAAVTILLRVTTHLDLVACFVTAVRGHQKQQGNEGFDDAKRYLLRSTGNIIAYLVSIVPLSVLAFATLKSAKPPFGSEPQGRRQAAKALTIALWITVVFAGFSGLFYVETERIWIFLTPAFALAAGYELARRGERESAPVIHLTLLLVLLISCTQEWFFMHYR